MNKVYYWIFFLLLLAGCQDRTDSSYMITGKVVNSLTDGNVVYLSHSNGDELVNLDSAIVDGGVFLFTEYRRNRLWLIYGLTVISILWLCPCYLCWKWSDGGGDGYFVFECRRDGAE